MTICRWLLVSLSAACLFPGGLAHAATDWLEQFHTGLYSGRTAAALTAVEERLQIAPDDDQARFAGGAARFLGAVEHLGQALHRYGLNNVYNYGYGMGGLPFLRLPIPANADPEPVTYEALRQVLEDFATEVQAAEQALGTVDGAAVALPLNVGRVRLDLDGDGSGSEGEALWQTIQVITGIANLGDLEIAGLETDFDGSDVLWLRAYCHLLMAMADFPLGYDWSEAYALTFHGLFPGGNFTSLLAANDRAVLQRLKDLGPPPTPPAQRGIFDPESWTKYQEWLQTEEGKRYEEFERLTSSLWIASIADLVAFVHLAHWPVAEPDRLKGVLEHLTSMVALSRGSWTRILAESDSGREWIPNLQQKGVLPGLTVTQERIDGWFLLLDELDDILAGTKLIPHWRFQEGISLRRFLLEPQPFDPVLLIQGSAAEPFLEKGEKTGPQVWGQIMTVFGGDFLRYFLWIN